MQAVFNRRKNALFRRATELSNMCDCEVAVIMFTADGELAQFSSSSMEDILRRYGRACTELHEVQTKEGMNKRAAENGPRNGPAKKRVKSEAAEPSGRAGARSGEEDTAEAILAMLDMPAEHAAGGKTATEEMDKEFNKLIEERAKRAQQAAAGGTDVATTAALHIIHSGSVTEKELVEATTAKAAPPAVAAAPPAAPAMVRPAAPAGANGAAGPTSAIDSLAAMLAGNPTPSKMGPPRATAASVKIEKMEENGAATTLLGNGHQINDPSVPPNPDSNVETPSVIAAGPVAGSADAIAPLSVNLKKEPPSQNGVHAGGA